jgi:hypothetical protein
MPNQNEAERIQTSTKMIVESMLFDAIRIQKYRHSGQLEFPREDDLHAHFVLMDVR